MYLSIKPLTDLVKSMYSNNQHFHPGDSGLDLYCPETITIYPGETTCINLQIQCEAFVGSGREGSSERNMSYYLYPRSSLAKTPLRLANSVGIIDKSYRGKLLVKVDNNSNKDFEMEEGKCYFQIIAFDGNLPEYTVVDKISTTKRGTGGFGSTDIDDSLDWNRTNINSPSTFY